MPNVRLCSVCNGHNATNYHLTKVFSIPEINRRSSVQAGTIDLCDGCWDRLTNKRTLTIDKIGERIANRRDRIIERFNGDT